MTLSNWRNLKFKKQAFPLREIRTCLNWKRRTNGSTAERNNIPNRKSGGKQRVIVFQACNWQDSLAGQSSDSLVDWLTDKATGCFSLQTLVKRKKKGMPTLKKKKSLYFRGKCQCSKHKLHLSRRHQREGTLTNVMTAGLPVSSWSVGASPCFKSPAVFYSRSLWCGNDCHRHQTTVFLHFKEKRLEDAKQIWTSNLSPSLSLSLGNDSNVRRPATPLSRANHSAQSMETKKGKTLWRLAKTHYWLCLLKCSCDLKDHLSWYEHVKMFDTGYHYADAERSYINNFRVKPYNVYLRKTEMCQLSPLK